VIIFYLIIQYLEYIVCICKLAYQFLDLHELYLFFAIIIFVVFIFIFIRFFHVFAFVFIIIIFSIFSYCLSDLEIISPFFFVALVKIIV